MAFTSISSLPMMHSFHLRFPLFCMLIATLVLFNSSGPRTTFDGKEHPFGATNQDAVDSLLSQLSIEEKIAQSFILKEKSDLKLQPSGYLLHSISELNEGPSDPTTIPLIYGVDLLHDDHINEELHIPTAEQFTSVRNRQVVQSYASSLGRSLKHEGIDFVIGPSLDLESSESPLTDEESFGEASGDVIATAEPMIDGLKDAGVVGVAGRFPGLGSTNRGYDVAPPTVYAKRNELNREHLIPFKAMINHGLQGVMMGNAFVPGLDSGHNAMASTSPVIHDVLSDRLGFNGLVWADLSNATAEQFDETTIQNAYLAKNDLLIVQNNLEQHVQSISALLEDGRIGLEEVNARCKRVLESKIWMISARRNDRAPAKKDLRELELNARRVFSESMVLVKNRENTLPISELDKKNIAVIKVSIGQSQELKDALNRYANTTVFHFRYENLEADFNSFQSVATNFSDLIIIAEPEDGDLPRKRFGMSENLVSIIDRASQQIPTTLAWNGSFKAIKNLENTDELMAVLIGHDIAPWSDDLTVQALFGGRAVNGVLKRNINEQFLKEDVQATNKVRLAYGMPEEVGISASNLAEIDSLAMKGIKSMAYPGCQVWFAKNGVVVVDKAYGFHTYREERQVLTSDLYDLASITKIAGSVAGLMKLSDEGKFNLDHRLCDYLSEWVDTTSYMQLSMREILAHQAGLTPWIPFYTKTITKGVPRYDVYSLAQSETYPLRVAREFYIRADYPETMFRQILNHKLSPNKKYKYSDIGYYFALRIIEKQSGMKLDAYLDSTYYQPLGLRTMGYHPLDRFPKDRIAPTEFDRVFRNQLIHGDVHDPGAAMLGGVGGHAGLFSNANDLGILMQMYLNGGTYGGQRFFNEETIEDYTRCQFCENDNRRGAGFDKPLTDGSEGPSCGCTTLDAFGHQGFTGTVTWADPEEDIVYVFLSNRVYPDAGNKKLLELNIRTDIQKAFYKAVEESKDLASD